MEYDDILGFKIAKPSFGIPTKEPPGILELFPEHRCTPVGPTKHKIQTRSQWHKGMVHTPAKITCRLTTVTRYIFCSWIVLTTAIGAFWSWGILNDP